MSPVYHGWSIALRSLGLAIWLLCSLPAPALPQADEQTAIRRLAENYFAAYQKEDVEGVMSLWSAKSPEVAATRQSLQQTFADAEKIVVNIVKLGTATIETDRAKIRIAVEISAVEAKTGQPAAGFGRLHRTLELVREGVEWKVWRSVQSEEELAVSLVAAKTEGERQSLLEADKDLVTVELEKALVRHGQKLSNQGSYAEAQIIYNLALQIAAQLGDKAGTASTLRNIGNIHNAQGSYAQALEYYRQSLKLAEEISDKALISRAVGNIGIVYSSQGNYTEALQYYQQSLKLAEELGDKIVIGNTLNNLGVVQDLQANYTEALAYFRRSLKLREEIGDRIGIALSLNNIGNVYESQGNYIQALEYFQQSLKLAEEISDKVGITRALNNIGNVHNLQGNYTQALAYYQRSLKLREELGNKAGIAATLTNIGVIYEAQGDYARALAYYRTSLKMAEEVGDKERIARALHNIGLIHYYQGSYAQALEYYRQSLKLREELGDKAAIARTLTHIGMVYEAQGNYTGALELADRAASLAGQIGNLERLWEARTIAGKAHQALNQPVLARRALDDAISTIERLRGQVAGNEQEQQRYFENKLAPYYQMVALLIAQNKLAEALAFAERAKGRVLVDVLRSGRANITKAMTTAEQAREQKLNSELISLNTQLARQKLQPNPDAATLFDLTRRLDKARIEYESFQTTLYAAHPGLKIQRGETPPLTLNEAARLLPADGKTALVEYSIANDKSFLFVLTKAAPSSKQDTPRIVLKVYPLDLNSKELEALVLSFKKRLGERNLAFSSLAQRLYELLLKPAEAQLRGKDLLCIVPDGVLWQLPFQALKPTARRYLIEEQAIFYAPSLTTLREMMKPVKGTGEGRAPTITPVLAGSGTGARQSPGAAAQQQSSPTLLAFGNPLLNPQTLVRQQAVYRSEELGELPEAEREVNSLRELYGAARSQVYIGAAAREERVKAEIGNYRIVHFATHGILDNRSPLYSHLLLAQETGSTSEDGLLEAREIMEMSLQAELVVLSACQTAGGRVGAGEGVIGMTWALFVAGSPTTLVSQWKVDTRSTSKLMVEFHANLQRQRRQPPVIGKAQALRQAMLTLLRSEEYELPYYWAPFVLIGNGF